MNTKLIVVLLTLITLMGCNPLGQSSVKLLKLDYGHLIAIQKGIHEKSPEYLVAYQRLIKEAENALNRSCYTVTRKESTPPSGDQKDGIIDAIKLLQNSNAWNRGDTELAGDIISTSGRLRIDQQIDSSGHQEHELSRTRAYRYSVMNLQALMYPGKMGEIRGNDLWNYQSPQAGSIQNACDLIFPYIKHFGEWPFEQITPVDWSWLIPLVSECSRVYKDPRYDAYMQSLLNEIKPTNRLILTKL